MKPLAGIILVALFLASGCALFEQGARMGAEIAVDAIKAQLPGLAGPILDEAKNLADKGIEEATLYANQKATEATNAAMLYVVRGAGLDPATFDYNADGKLSESEMTAALSAVENRATNEPGEVPWWIQALSSTGGLALLFTAGKSLNRYRREKNREEVAAVVKNGGAPAPA